MAINRYREANFPVNLTWKQRGDHTVRIENQISSLCVGKSARLTDARIGQAVKVLEDGCFNGCTNLSSLTFIQDFDNADGQHVQGTRLQEIGVSAFADCTSLSAIKFNDDLVSDAIKDSAFRNSGISSITVKTGTVGTYAFENTENLADIKLSATGSIGKYAFARSSVKTADVSCNSSSARMFHECSSLTDAVVDAKVLKFGDFAGCTKLSSLTLNGLEKIDLGLPQTNKWLNDINDNLSLEWYNADSHDDKFYYSNDDFGLKNKLKLGVFHECSSLSTVTFPQTFRGIDPDKLTSIQYSHAYQTGGKPHTDVLTIDPTDIPLFYHSNIQEINFDFIENSPTGDDAAESTDGIQVVLYPKIFSEVHTDNSDTQLTVNFNDTYDQLYDIIVDKNGNPILDELIQTTLDTNHPGSIVFQFKEAHFDPSQYDTLLMFADTQTEQIIHAIPIPRDSSDPKTATVIINPDSSIQADSGTEISNG